MDPTTAPPREPMTPDAPRPQHWTRRRPLATWAFLGINVAVFLLWQAAGDRGTPLYAFMDTNFVVSTGRLAAGQWWTTVTSAFSQQMLFHLLFNMVVLLSFGSVLERLWGTRVYVAFYLVTAVVSSLAHCWTSTYLLGLGDMGALGASGVMSGLLLAFALMYPKHKILLFAVVPLPAIVAALGLVVWDIWGLISQGQGMGLPIGHGAHLGGALCGALFWLFYLRRRFPRSGGPGGPRQVEVPLTSEEAAEFQRLRDKLDRHGPHALTPKEQAFLEGIRRRALGGASRAPGK